MISLLVPTLHAESRPSLTAAFSERIGRLLIPRDAWRPFPKAAIREVWNSLPSEVRARLVSDGEAAKAKPWEPIPATMFLEFYRSGSKEPYQGTSFARRDRLASLVLAECAEGKGRFLDEIVNGIWAIAEESFWGNSPSTWVQASLEDQQRYSDAELRKIRTNLPDITRPGVDLWVAETAGLLAMTDYLLGPELDRISPLVRHRIRLEVDRRMLTPLLERDFKWMRESGNWNPWITSNWLTAVLLLEPDDHRRIAAVRKAMRSLDGYLGKYPADGGCDEGPGYWRRSAGSLFDSLELLHSASQGTIQVFDSPLVRDIGAYIYRTHIAGRYFMNFADAHATLSMPAELMIRYGRQVKDPRLQAFGASMPEGDAISRSGSLLRRVPALMEIASGPIRRADPPLPRDVWLPEVQVMAARWREGSAEGLFLGAKGGHNGEGHNHNDVGNFLVYADGRPVIIDVGPEAYTEKNSSPERYSLWTMQSAYHNLPTVNGVMQAAGRRFTARGVNYRQDDDSAELSMELAGVYPPQAGLQSWRRTLRLNRGSNIQLTDRFVLGQAARDLTLTLMTPCRIRQRRPGVLELLTGDSSRPVQLIFEHQKLSAKLEEIPLQDRGLRKDWGDTITRILLVAATTQREDVWNVSFRFPE
jgi:hypothetical protein